MAVLIFVVDIMLVHFNLHFLKVFLIFFRNKCIFIALVFVLFMFGLVAAVIFIAVTSLNEAKDPKLGPP